MSIQLYCSFALQFTWYPELPSVSSTSQFRLRNLKRLSRLCGLMIGVIVQLRRTLAPGKKSWRRMPRKEGECAPSLTQAFALLLIPQEHRLDILIYHKVALLWVWCVRGIAHCLKACFDHCGLLSLQFEASGLIMKWLTSLWAGCRLFFHFVQISMLAVVRHLFGANVRIWELFTRSSVVFHKRIQYRDGRSRCHLFILANSSSYSLLRQSCSKIVQMNVILTVGYVMIDLHATNLVVEGVVGCHF